MPDHTVSVPPTDPSFVITRRFLAPRDLVWDCFTRPEHMVQFWGPHGATTPVCELDLRPGGMWRTVMRFESGQEHAYASIFTAVARPASFAYRDAPYDWPGGLDGLLPPDMESLVELTEAPGGTLLRLTVTCPDIATRDAQISGGFGAVVEMGCDRLETYLEDLMAKPG